MKTGARPDTFVSTPSAKLRVSADGVIADYRLAVRSRAASELSRREVLVGNAPFGISGEGKEIAQLAMARSFRPGDWRSGYYRDQTFMFAGVLRVPLLISIWDDGYGISVPNELQTTKGSISEVLRGFQRAGDGPGYDLHVVKGWDYLACCEAYAIAAERARTGHVPAVLHVTEMTQPQGHSTSASTHTSRAAPRSHPSSSNRSRPGTPIARRPSTAGRCSSAAST